MNGNPLCSICILLFLYHPECHKSYTYIPPEPIKSINLTTTNTIQEGANITVLLPDEVTTTNSSWDIVVSQQIGFHLQIDLDETWFTFNETSVLTFTLYSDTPIPAQANNPDLDLLITFSVNADQWITVFLLLDVHSNRVTPGSCDPDDGWQENINSGDIASIVNTERYKGEINRDLKIAPGDSFDTLFPGNRDQYKSYKNAFPILVTLINDPIDGTLEVTVTNPEWLEASFIQSCTYNNSFNIENGLQIYIGGDDNGEEISFQAFGISYSTDILYTTTTANPSTMPTASPTATPTMDTVAPTPQPTPSPVDVRAAGGDGGGDDNLLYYMFIIIIVLVLFVVCLMMFVLWKMKKSRRNKTSMSSVYSKSGDGITQMTHVTHITINRIEPDNGDDGMRAGDGPRKEAYGSITHNTAGLHGITYTQEPGVLKKIGSRDVSNNFSKDTDEDIYEDQRLRMVSQDENTPYTAKAENNTPFMGPIVEGTASGLTPAWTPTPNVPPINGMNGIQQNDEKEDENGDSDNEIMMTTTMGNLSMQLALHDPNTKKGN